MNWKAFRIGMLALAMAAGPMATSAPAQDKTLFIPLLVYRTGPYAPSGIPIAKPGPTTSTSSTSATAGSTASRSRSRSARRSTTPSRASSATSA